MEENSRSVDVRLDRETFREFAVFDGLVRQRRWVRIAAFALFFCTLSALAFARAARVEGAAVLGGALLAVGLGLPTVYLGVFFRSVAVRARAVDPREIVYTLTLGADALGVKKGKESVSYAWASLYGAYRLRRCVCLYAAPGRAFLLPDAQGEAWRLIAGRVEQDRLHDCTNR
ncbi:MAG: hypothetical protein E7425_10665 [Ruminococcaceae bacterium]|nr:hypothetical protein [Oscillospiraceae bacterium]